MNSYLVMTTTQIAYWDVLVFVYNYDLIFNTSNPTSVIQV